MADLVGIHPARLYSFDQLIDGLKEAHARKLVVESSNKDGLLLYVYSSKCVYDQLWNDFTLLARGLISKEIAMRLCVSTRTVERRIFDIKQKVKKLEGELNGKSFK